MKVPLPVLVMLLGGLLLAFAGGVEMRVNPPQPRPEPIPPGERFVLVVHESSQRTAAEAATMAGLRRWLEEHRPSRYLIVDKDLVGPSGATAEWLSPYLSELSNRSVNLPALVVSVPPSDTSGGAYLAVEPLPGRAQEAISIVEEALARE